MNSCESGDPVENDFIQSWNRITECFDLTLDEDLRKDRVLIFIAQLRRAGYDRKLRAGQTVDMFIVSRSRRHGLRPDQPFVVFCFHRDVMDVREGNDECIRGADISLSPPVEAVLTRLLNHPID
jgi:hypothetical protein